MLLRISLAALAIAVASPALADAATYWGKLGTTDIVIELSKEFGAADEATVGRYLYAKKGIDIPLHVLEATPEKLVLYEEFPCTPKLCEPAFEAGGSLPEKLRGAIWTLSSTDGQNLRGTWVAEKGAKPLPIDVGLFGTRPFETTENMQPYQLTGLPFEIIDGEEELTYLNHPYEYLKATSVDPESGEDIKWGDVTFRYLTDPRVTFAFPQVVDLSTSSVEDVVPANQRLFTRRYVMANAGLDCESQAYFGMGWSPGADNWLGSYAGYPDEQVEVLYLSPTVMSWSESGSLYCGGAYPENHTYLTTIDMKTGKDLDLSKIFADSKMGDYRWEPGQSPSTSPSHAG